MAKPLRPKRGTTAKNDAFTGLAFEITVDTEKHSIRVHDGVTAGGHEILPAKSIDVGVIKVNGKTGEVVVLGVNEAQSLTEAQQEQALSNLGLFSALETLITEAGGTIPS